MRIGRPYLIQVVTNKKATTYGVCKGVVTCVKSTVAPQKFLDFWAIIKFLSQNNLERVKAIISSIWKSSPPNYFSNYAPGRVSHLLEL